MDELNIIDHDHPVSIDFEDEDLSSFILQPCLNDDQYKKTISYILKSPLCISQTYQEEFLHHYHINYYGELEREGLFLASIRSIPTKTNEIDKKSLDSHSTLNEKEDNQLVRALIRTETTNYDVSQIIYINNEQNILQLLFRKAQLSPIQHYEPIHDIKANEKIMEFDKSDSFQHSSKIGILFQRLNQINEDEILGNNEMSIEMENFLNLISEQVELEGFENYRADLDIKTNQHGTYSYFTIFENHQIMFNIGPIIPPDKNSQQFIQRKSLIGNSLLTIVFQEEETLFKPNFIISKFTQVYITVQPIQTQSELHYKIEIWRRGDIEPLIDPPGGILKHDESFRNCFLILILNTMNIILKKDCFHLRIIQQRHRVKSEYLNKLCHTFDSYSKQFSNDNMENSSSTKDSSVDPNTLSQSKHFSFRLLPKIIGAFNNTQTKANKNSVSSSQSTVENESPSTLITRVLQLRQNRRLSKEKMSNLITNMPNSIESNQKRVETTNNNSIEDENNLDNNNNDEELNQNQNIDINRNN